VETDNPALEEIWRELRPHLEWAQGFALVFLFAGHPAPIEFLRRRLEDSLQLRTLRLTIVAPATPGEVPRAVEELLAIRPEPGRGPLWFELWRGSAEKGWPTARRQALRRLNERRFLLEQDVAVPVVFVLPREERAKVYIDAPDLWAVRSFTAELPAPERREVTVPRHEADTVTVHDPSRGPAEMEWQRLVERAADRTNLDPRDGFAAFESAMERGDLAAARAITDQTLDMARQRLQTTGDTPQALRDLSISLDNVGRVERDLGNLETARSAYQESLEIARQLAGTFPDQPRYQQDLAFIEDRLAGVTDIDNIALMR
jgi:hypothetical protein